MRASDSESPPGDALVGEIVMLLRKVIYAPDGSITAETKLSELGMDSLDLIEAGLELEALLGRDLPENALTEARTIGELARCFGEQLPPRAGLSLAA